MMGAQARSEELGVSSVPVFVVHAVSAQPMLPVLLHGAVPAEELAAAMDAVSGPAG
jgi:predicted DsbA family dithiol-disulfide isomerase